MVKKGKIGIANAWMVKIKVQLTYLVLVQVILINLAI